MTEDAIPSEVMEAQTSVVAAVGSLIARKLSRTSRKGLNVRDLVDDAKKAVKSCQSEYSIIIKSQVSTNSCHLVF